MWSDRDKSAFTDENWKRFWRWYREGGLDIVASYLRTRDLAAFNPKAPPPQTDAFYDIVNPSRSQEDAELADALDLPPFRDLNLGTSSQDNWFPNRTGTCALGGITVPMREGGGHFSLISGGTQPAFSTELGLGQLDGQAVVARAAVESGDFG